jgi:hypothetical protein
MNAGALREAVRVQVRAVIEAYRSMPRDDALVATRLDALIAEARTDDVRPEHLVVALRNEWHSQRLAEGEWRDAESTAAFARMIDQCLSTYYARPKRIPVMPAGALAASREATPSP